MLQVQYTADPVDLDQSLREVAVERGEKPIRLRLQPALLRESGDYIAWKGVAWTVQVMTVAEAVEIRSALEAFFKALTTFGPAQVIAGLTGDPDQT